MISLRKTGFHNNVGATILFDGGALKTDRAACRARARFGRGVLAYVPHSGRCDHNHQDELDRVAMLAEDAARATTLPTPSQLASQIRADLSRCRKLAGQFDAIFAKLHDIRPVCGGAPSGAERHDEWSKNIDAIMEGIDDDDAIPMTDADVAAVNVIG
jgi:hypothetical protein